MSVPMMVSAIEDVAEQRARQTPPWFSFVIPGEEPPLFRGKLRWRRRHERIRNLEHRLGFYERSYRLPWEDVGW